MVEKGNHLTHPSMEPILLGTSDQSGVGQKFLSDPANPQQRGIIHLFQGMSIVPASAEE